MTSTRRTPEQLEKRRQTMAKPSTATVMKVMARAHLRIFRLTGGRIGNSLPTGVLTSVPTLMLDHVGRTSGTAYTTPLVYLADGQDLVVVASQGGMAKDPQWYANLVAHPDTQVQIRREVRRVHARVAAPAERASLWPRLIDLYADYDTYQAITEREIPLMVLEPR